MSKLTMTPDRRTVLFGLATAAAAASFSPILTAGASAAPAAMAIVPAAGSYVPAVFWNLAYNDFTGLTPAYAPPKRKAVVAPAHDLDPHAEMLAGR